MWSRSGALALLVLSAVSCREPDVARVPAGRLVRARETGRSILSLVPDQTRAGEIFAPQPGGEAGLVVLGTELTRGDLIRWNGRPLKTTFDSSRRITAAVPPELLASPGEVALTIEDEIDPSRAQLSASFRVLAPPADRPTIRP